MKVNDVIYLIKHCKEFRTKENFEYIKSFNPSVDDICFIIINYNEFATKEVFDYLKTLKPNTLDVIVIMVACPHLKELCQEYLKTVKYYGNN